MTDTDKEKVENFIKSIVPDGINVVSIVTNQNFGIKTPSYMTHVVLKDEKTDLTSTQSFNSLKILRQLKKEEKYVKKT